MGAHSAWGGQDSEGLFRLDYARPELGRASAGFVDEPDARDSQDTAKRIGFVLQKNLLQRFQIFSDLTLCAIE